jgi:hypothetical protein
MELNTTSNSTSVISWGSVLLVKEAGVPGENHQPAASHIIFHGYSRSYIYSSNLLLELYKRLLLHVFSCYITILSITNDISVLGR